MADAFIGVPLGERRLPHQPPMKDVVDIGEAAAESDPHHEESICRHDWREAGERLFDERAAV
jgi:hypothetical protein